MLAAVAMHVVFDFDGTLVDSLGLLIRTYNGIAERRGFKRMTSDSIAEMRRLDPRARVRFLNIRWYQIPAVARELKRTWQAELSRLQCFPGIPELLADLHGRGMQLGVISSNATENIHNFVALAGLPAFVDVRSSGIFDKHRVIAKYLRKHRLTPEQVVYVGDEVRDAHACRAAGVRMIAVTWGADQRESFADCPPAAFADAPAHVVEFLDSH
jgi:phosphoglycolate phosphatase